jgi:2'-5' RNA ligase
MDRGEAQRRIWEAFRRTERVADGRHDTPNWRSRGGPFAMCCVRVPAATLQPALDALRADLSAFRFVRLHPDGFLHVMLQEFGFVVAVPRRADEIGPDRLGELTDVAIGVGRDRPPFDIALGWANAFQDAVFLELHKGGGSCTRLHQRLRESAGAISAPRFPYLPHATIAHFTADAPAAGLLSVLAPRREAPFGRFTVREIEIVTLRTDEAYPPLETYAAIPLLG